MKKDRIIGINPDAEMAFLERVDDVLEVYTLVYEFELLDEGYKTRRVDDDGYALMLGVDLREIKFNLSLLVPKRDRLTNLELALDAGERVARLTRANAFSLGMPEHENQDYLDGCQNEYGQEAILVKPKLFRTIRAA